MKIIIDALKNGFMKPATTKYPYEKVSVPQGFRGKHVYKKEDCIYCGMCAKVCPAGAITVDREKKEWSVDLGKCIFCAECATNCPKKCLKLGDEFELADSLKQNLVIKK